MDTDGNQGELDSTLPKRPKRDETSSSMSVILNDFRKQKVCCDVNLIVDNEVCPAHKVVLIAFSPFFEAKLLGEFAEANNQRDVTLSNVDSCVMEPILNYAYTKEIELTPSNVYDILHASNYWQATSLFEECCQFLETNLKEEDCLSIYSLADFYLCKSLKEKAEKFILMNFVKVAAGLEFLELEQEKLVSIVSNDNLNVDKEEVIFDAVVKWLHHKQEDRGKTFEKVLREVRLAHVDPLFLHDRVQATKAIKESASCMRLIDYVNMYNLFPSRRMELQVPFTRRRASSSYVEALEIYRTCPKTEERYDLLLTEDGRVVSWEGLGLPSDGTFYLRPIHYEMLAIKEDTKRVWIFDAKDESWKEIASLEHWDTTTAFVELDKSWYAIGGAPGKSYSKSVTRYDPSENSWTSIAPLLEAVSNSTAAVSVSGQLYVVGGYVSEVVKLQRFDPRNSCGIWVEETTLPQELTQSLQSACALNNRIYVCADKCTKVVFYDCSSAQWGTCADFNNPFYRHLVPMNGRLFAVTERPDGERVIERYIPGGSGLWQEFAIFPGLELVEIKSPMLYSRDRIDSNGDDHLKLLV